MELKAILEAALFAAQEPLDVARLRTLFEEGEQPAAEALHAAVQELADDYTTRPLELVKVAGGWRFQVRAAYSPWVSRLFEEKPGRYSRAVLETLAIVAYRQPVTRGEIEQIRGVGVSQSVLRTLLDREWVHAVGHKDVPGRPALYATTRRFLDYFGLQSLEQLPTLKEIADLDGIATPAEAEALLAAAGQIADNPVQKSSTATDTLYDENTQTPAAEAAPNIPSTRL